MSDLKPVCKPISPNDSLGKDDTSLRADQPIYRGMIGSLLYLTASRPDIMFSTYLCARFQYDPRDSHVKGVRRIFCYLKGTDDLWHWY